MATKRKVLIASDHAGFEFKELIRNFFSEQFEWIDLGAHAETSVDYPDYAKLAAQRVQKDSSLCAVLICGSGLGMAIAANRFKGIRAASVSDSTSARLSRSHNNANIICLGSRIVGLEVAKDIVAQFLTTDFHAHESRHQQRIEKIEL